MTEQLSVENNEIYADEAVVDIYNENYKCRISHSCQFLIDAGELEVTV